MKRLPLMLVRYLPMATLCSLLGACNGYIGLGSPIGSAFSIGGTLSGLPNSQLIVLLNNGRDSLTLIVDGPFMFGRLVPFDGSYVAAISTQPVSTNYVVTSGNDRVNGDVNNVRVTCQPR